MATIILYKPDGAEKYLNATDVGLDHGVLTFYFDEKKIITTVPFLIEENLAAAA
jgi:hypothetical protein